MTEDIKGLLEKIQREGVTVAEEKARQIEGQARLKAEDILNKAKKDSAKVLAEAKDKVSKMEENSRALLKQAARDMLIALRKDISDTLDKIVSIHLQEALAPQALTQIITNLVKDCSKQAEGDIVISLKKEDLQRLEKGFLAALKSQTQKGIILKQSDDLRAGFTISFDAGKSHYDFSDKALAGYIGTVLKPKLNELLNI